MKSLFYAISFCLFMFGACKVKNYPSDSKPIPHDLWDELLSSHVKNTGVDYKGLMSDSVKLNKYLKLLSSNHPNDKHWTKEEQLAYWINAYNAFTIQIVLRNYPVKSIKKIKTGIPFINSVWDIKFIQIENAIYDLNNIEHGIIRSNYEEPRIHFALNCASVSCPDLRNEAYVAENLETQLREQTKSFLTDSTKNRFSENTIQLSKIFSWYRQDFKEQGGVIPFIRKNIAIELNPKVKTSYLTYNWNLNDI